jgi:hypothetical protein
MDGYIADLKTKVGTIEEVKALWEVTYEARFHFLKESQTTNDYFRKFAALIEPWGYKLVIKTITL